MLPTILPAEWDYSATTGNPSTLGDYRGPLKNHAPNPDGYWWGQVFTVHGWKDVQEIGRDAVEAKMIALGANCPP